MYFMLSALIWTLAIFFWDTTRCSLVTDRTSQKSIVISDYCPKMNNCPEGAHTMCMNYNPDHKMGPHCYNGQNTTITPLLASKLLDITNAFPYDVSLHRKASGVNKSHEREHVTNIRSKLALGKETGQNRQPLPRAYGMFRLLWDSELATFAQVLADQCIVQHDLCRSSKRFPDPGQSVGLVRFTLKNWDSVSTPNIFTTNGLTFEKLSYAAKQVLKTNYEQKVQVTPDMIESYPDWNHRPDKSKARLYLDMVYASATHIGCGVSAYEGYKYQAKLSEFFYGVVQIVCNFSARPQKGLPVYNTTPPEDNIHFSPCGCPENAFEDSDCLCQYKNTVLSIPKHLRSCGSKKNCAPPVVVLPIFTVEDAPPHKLISRQSPSSSNEKLRRTDLESIFKTPDFELGGTKQKPYENFLEPDLISRNYKRYPLKRTQFNVKKRYFDKKSLADQQYRNTMTRKQGFSHVPGNRRSTQTFRASIFSRAPQFKLRHEEDHKHLLHLRNDSNQFTYKKSLINKDVRPRKDFSNLNNLVDNYIHKKKQSIGIPTHQGTLKSFDPKDLHDEITYLNKISEKRQSTKCNTLKCRIQNSQRVDRKSAFNYFNVSSREHVNDVDLQYPHEEGDKKLMALLDNLEQEVRHIQLNTNEKELFDAKIRKIYGDVVGKPTPLLPSKHPKVNEYNSNHGNSLYNRLENFENIGQNILDSQIISKHRRNNDDIYSDSDYLHNDNASNGPFSKRKINKYSGDKLAGDPNEIKSRKDYKNTLYDEKNLLGHGYDLETKFPGKSERGSSRRASNIGIKTRNSEALNTHNYKNIHSRRMYDVKDADLRLVSDTVAPHSYRYLDSEDTKRQYKGNIYDDKRKLDNTDVLAYERRKYYQDKLDNIERKMHHMRNYKRRSEHDLHQMMAVRPTNENLRSAPRKLKNELNPIYIADRARSLHGF